MQEPRQKHEQIVTPSDGKLIYIKDGAPKHAGVVKADGKYYYASDNGVILTDTRHVIHSAMSNGLLSHGTYIGYHLKCNSEKE